MNLADPMAHWIVLSILVSLRVAPVFVVAPPFSLTRMPVTFRALLGVGLAAALVSAHQELAQTQLALAQLLPTALHELLIGLTFSLAFQLAYAGLYLAGRTIDIQAGFGLAVVIDPTSRSQTPLVGALFALTAGAVFFAMDGHLQVLRLLGASFYAAPIGSFELHLSLSPLSQFIGAILLAAFGVAAVTVAGLFLTDLAIAALSRTVPQMNVLVLGFQVKTLAMLVLLPAAFGATGALFARTATLTLEAIPRLI